LGGVLFSVLYQRGLFVLHASGVNIGGNVVAFLGLKGQGKSTMAATLYGRGHSLVSDDMLAIQIDGDNGPMAIPGFPNFKIGRKLRPLLWAMTRRTCLDSSKVTKSARAPQQQDFRLSQCLEPHFCAGHRAVSAN
jgi:ATP-dependent phosphoenolpyruvate carboxykinase